VIAGLGGRAIPRKSLRALFENAERDDLEQLTFLDLKWDMVNRELARMRGRRRSGPIAENILRELGTVAARIG
jgi:pyruvate ferredoxin oxidoreductase alpha subunit